jgi:hypothetical protein
MVAQVGYSVAGRLADRITLCAICTVHEEMRSAVSWLSLKTKVDGLSLKSLGWFVSGLTSKPQGQFPGLTSKPVAMVSPGLASKPMATGFLIWSSKSTAAVL